MNKILLTAAVTLLLSNVVLADTLLQPGQQDDELFHTFEAVNRGHAEKPELCAANYKTYPEQVNVAIKSGDTLGAALTALNGAESMSGCAIAVKKWPTLSHGAGDWRPSVWAMAAGTFLTTLLSLDLQQGGHLRDQEHQQIIEHARTLLTYANNDGQHGAAEMLNKLDRLLR